MQAGNPSSRVSPSTALCVSVLPYHHLPISAMRYRVEHYTQFIQKNPEWELAGIFADDGISGCNTKNAVSLSV